MSTPLAIENPGDTRQSCLSEPARIGGRLRAALVRIALLGVALTAACQAIPGDAGSTPDAVTRSTPRGPHVGEFSGRYQDGLPVYLFPTIYVFAKRPAE